MTESLHIWVTGAARGIGAAIARNLAGAHHVSISDISESSLSALAELLPTGSYTISKCDVADASDVRSTYDSLVAKNGQIDVLINNAGIGSFKSVLDSTIEEFDAQIMINLRGTFLCTKAVLPAMVQRKSGMIITMNSVASLKAFPGNSGYGASKAGALALMRSLREEVRNDGIKITDMFLGATETAIWSDEAREEHRSRMMKADDIASSVRSIVDGFYNPRTHIEELVLRPQKGDL